MRLEYPDPPLGDGIVRLRPWTTDEALGAVVLLARPEPGLVGLGYWVIERARRRGLAARAVRLLAPGVLAQAPIVRIEALVEASNTNSGRVLLNAGFRPEGRLRAHFAFAGQPTDAVVYSLVAADFPPGWNSSSP